MLDENHQIMVNFRVILDRLRCVQFAILKNGGNKSFTEALVTLTLTM